MKRAYPTSFAGGLSWKRARRKPEAEVPLQGASHPEVGLVDSNKEEELAPPLIRSRRSKSSATSEGTIITEGISQKLR